MQQGVDPKCDIGFGRCRGAVGVDQFGFGVQDIVEGAVPQLPLAARQFQEFGGEVRLIAVEFKLFPRRFQLIPGIADILFQLVAGIADPALTGGGRALRRLQGY